MSPSKTADTTPPASTPAWTLTHVDPSTIKAHADNPRAEVGDLDDLTASILEQGILEPLVVAPPHPGITARSMGKATHLLIAGHRRLAAAKKAKLATVPVIVRADLITRAAQVEAMLVENLQRVDLTPVEEADAYQLVLTLDGLTQKDLAAKVGQPLSRIRDRLKLTKISEPVRQKIQTHQVTIADALAIAEFDDDPKTQKGLLAAIGTRDMHFALNRARSDREATKNRKALLDRLAVAGVTVSKERPKGARTLGELNVSGGSWTSSNDESVETKHHAKCPGRAAWMEYSSVTYGCTQPKLHPKPKVTKSKEELKREAQEKADRAETVPALEAAAHTRAEHLQWTIADQGSTPTQSPFAVRLRALIIKELELGEASYYYGDTLKNAGVFLEVLGKAVPDRDKDTSDAEHARALLTSVKHATESLTVTALVVVLDIAVHLSDEAVLRKYSSYNHYSSQQSWLEALNTYGYAWSTFERERFTWLLINDEPGVNRQWTVDGLVEIKPEGAADAAEEA